MVALVLCGAVGTASFAVAPLILPSVAVNFCLGILLNGIYSNCFALIQDQVDKADIPIATGMVGTVAFGTASFSGWLIVTAATELGWLQGAALVYAIPYLICACVLFFNPSIGRKPTEALGV